MGPADTVQCTFHVAGLQNAIILELITISGGHTHTSSKTIAQINASCITNGTKQHYVCSCGLKFTDAACTNPITSEDALIIPPTNHTISGYKNDTNNHWKVCTKCGSEIVDTRDAHTNSNRDNKCDVCSYQFPVKDSEGNVNISGNTETKPTTSETKPSSPSDSTTNSTSTESPSETTGTQTDNSTTVGVGDSGNNVTPDTAEQDNEIDVEEDDQSIPPSLLILMIAVGGGVAIYFVLFANKQR